MPRRASVAIALGCVLAGGIALAVALWLVGRSDEDPADKPEVRAPVCADFAEYVSQCEHVVGLAQEDIATFWSRYGYNAAPFDIELVNWPTTCLGGAFEPPCKPIHTLGFKLQFPLSVLESVEYHTDMGSRVELAGMMTVDYFED